MQCWYNVCITIKKEQKQVSIKDFKKKSRDSSMNALVDKVHKQEVHGFYTMATLFNNCPYLWKFVLYFY